MSEFRSNQNYIQGVQFYDGVSAEIVDAEGNLYGTLTRDGDRMCLTSPRAIYYYPIPKEVEEQMISGYPRPSIGFIRAHPQHGDFCLVYIPDDWTLDPKKSQLI